MEGSSIRNRSMTYLSSDYSYRYRYIYIAYSTEYALYHFGRDASRSCIYHVIYGIHTGTFYSMLLMLHQSESRAISIIANSHSSKYCYASIANSADNTLRKYKSTPRQLILSKTFYRSKNLYIKFHLELIYRIILQIFYNNIKYSQQIFSTIFLQ